MDNPSDLKYLLDEKNQEKIARDILDGIRKYHLQSGSNLTMLTSNANPPGSENGTVNSGPQIAGNQYGSIPVANAADSSAPLRKVEVEAEYPGGAAGWVNYLTKTLKYPDEAVNNEVQGSVIVEFVINENGSLTNIHAISGPMQLRAESVRVVTESGKWIPARDHGLVVASYHKQPINYKLSVK
jgi:protein TonB